MNEIETKIAAWRAGLAMALQENEAVVRELEAHLRDHLETLRRRGIGPDAAFAESVERLGEVHGLAREFERVRTPWWPSSWMVRGLMIASLAGNVVLVITIVHEIQAGRMTALLGAHAFLLTSGYLTVFITGVMGACAIWKTWRRPLAVTERRELRDVIFRLSAASCALVPLGIGLGMTWAMENRGTAWSWEQVEIGALCVLISAVLLFVTQLRGGFPERLRWLLAALGGIVVLFGMVCGAAVTPAVPIGWLWLASVASQGAAVMLRLPVQSRAMRE